MATSAVCVTGLVVVDTGSHFTPLGQFFIIMLIQIGALGFMTISTLMVMLLGKKIGLKERIMIQESFNQITMAGLVRLIKNVILVTLAFEVLGGTILSLRFMQEYPLERALAFGFFHSISAFCNAGFDLFGQVFGPYAGLTHYVGDVVVNFTVGFLIIGGGLGFPVIVELLKFPRTRKLSLHTKLVLGVTAFLIVAGAVVFFLLEMTNKNTLANLNVMEKILGSFFQSITPRTAGYNTLDISQLRIGTWSILILLMFIGASPSSTGGGIKTTTFGVLISTVWATIRGKEDVDVMERRIPTDLIFKAITIMSLALGWIWMVLLIMTLIEPFTFIQLCFEAVSAFGTVGLSTGITPSLTDLSRGVLILTMFIGRLGPMTVMVAMTKLQQPPGTRYIEDRVMIG